MGLTTAERRHPAFRSHGVGTCEWDGAVWPYATTQTLVALANVLRNYQQNYVSKKDYFDALDRGLLPVARGYILNRDDIIRRRVVMNLMCHFVLYFHEIEKEFGIDFKEYFAWGLENLKEMSDNGLVTVDDEKIEVSEMGRLLIRNIAMNFDGVIERKVDEMKYSRTV